MRRAFTLAELLVVLAIIAVLAGIVIPMLGSSEDDAKVTATNATMVQLRDTIMGRYRIDTGGKMPRPGDYGKSQGRSDTPQIRYLFVNPDTESGATPESQTNTFDPFVKRGWRGPYVLTGGDKYSESSVPASQRGWSTQGFSQTFGKTGDPAVLDGWRNPIVIVDNATVLGSTATGFELRSAGRPKSYVSGVANYSLDLGVHDKASTNNIWPSLTTN